MTEGLETVMETIHFPVDDLILKGTLHRPVTPGPPVIIGSHGLLSDSSSPKQTELAARCAARGIAFFRFDHRGCGESAGSFSSQTSLINRCRDLASAIRLIRNRTDLGKRVGLFGSSMGGTVALTVAASHTVDAIVTVAAPVRSDPIIDAIQAGKTDEPVLKRLPADQLVFDISEQLNGIRNILIFHGDADELVPSSDAWILHEKTSPFKRLVIQKCGDHRMSDPVHQQEFLRETVEWFSRFLMPGE